MDILRRKSGLSAFELPRDMKKTEILRQERDLGANFAVRDLYEASFLCAKGCELCGLQIESRRGKPIAFFLFNRTAEPEAEKYRLGQSSVNALMFVGAIERCKDILFENLRQSETRNVRTKQD